MRVINIRIEEDLLEMLEGYAIRHGMNRSVAIRYAIRLMLEKELEENPTKQAKVEKGYKLR
jgi:metal-responsive CopG/Arc/MetJ family transcriptional regulator